MKKHYIYMNIVVRFIILFSLVIGTTIPLFTQAAQPQNTTPSITQNCGTIETNWKRYGQSIKGANTKVTDVVLNACNAIGGVSQCRFSSGLRSAAHNAAVGGAKQSQHINGRAIDLRVPRGYEKKFITLAICGLKKVNNCQGGIGLYSSGAIHIDVRSGISNVWSDNHSRSDIAKKITDVAMRNILYGFGDGKCTSGSIAGSYNESNMYGSPAKYTPPQGFPSWFNPSSGDQAAIFKDIFDKIFNKQKPTQNPGGKILPDNPSGDQIPPAYTYIPPMVDRTSDNTQFIPVSYISDPNGFQGVDYIGIGSSNVVTCTKSSSFGIGLFDSCKGRLSVAGENNISANTAPSVNVYNTPTSHNGNTTFKNNISPQKPSTTDIAGETTSVATTSALVEVSSTQNTQSIFNDNNSAFVAGERRQQVQKNSTTIKDFVTFAEKSIWFGVYFVVINTSSPLVAGGMQHTLWQVGNYFL